MTEEESGAAVPLVTTVADAQYKALIEPYAESQPVLSIPAGVVACLFCGNVRFRRSRLRFRDLGELLLLRLPLRCMRCNQRQHGSYLTAAMAIGKRDRSNRTSKGKETWKSWTEQEFGGLSRPMSTAVGPRASNLRQPLTEPKARIQPVAKAAEPGWPDADREIW